MVLVGLISLSSHHLGRSLAKSSSLALDRELKIGIKFLPVFTPPHRLVGVMGRSVGEFSTVLGLYE